MADEDIIICAFRAMRVLPGQPERRTALPPAVLRIDNARVEMGSETRTGPHAPVRCGDHHPVPRLNPALGGRRRMQFHLWVRYEAPQAGQGAVLTMTKLRQLGTGEDERIVYRQVWLCHWPNHGLDILRERRIAVVQQALRVDFNFPGQRGKAAGYTVALVSVFAIASRQGHAEPCGRLLQCLQGYARRHEQLAIRRGDIPAPEVLAQPETSGQFKDDPGV